VARVDSIIARLDSVSRRLNPADRTIYKRTFAKSGGDPLIGRSSSTDVRDTLLDPQPLYQRLGRNSVTRSTSSAQSVLAQDGSTFQVADEYMCIVSPTAMSRAELLDPTILLVFKSTDGSEEIFKVTDLEPVPMNGKDAMFTIYVRSMSRGLQNA